MIRQIGLLHYLDEETFKALGAKFGIDTQKSMPKSRKSTFTNPDNPIRELELYTISYKAWGRIWFFPITLDMGILYGAPPGSLVDAASIDYEGFSERLFDAYRREFGSDLVESFPSTDHSVCSYAEFTVHIRVPDSGNLMAQLAAGRFTAEQLDIGCFDSYKLRNSTPWFTANKLDDHTIRLCAKCAGSALKILLKATGDARVGVPVPMVLTKDTAVDILSKQAIKHTKPDTPEELGRSVIWDSI